MQNFNFESFRSEPNSGHVDPPKVPGRSLDWLKTQASFGVPVWAICLNCDHSRLLDPADLVAMVKPDVTELGALADRMRCRGCGGKACELRAASPMPEYCA